ncbi:response regulator [Planktothrix pseudagardhii]|uniref:Circadian input-output histidine kinase CikA n=1 Tax=Planktothrix pseudagardhii TaxID=132604 RepID=A0A9W4CXW6_9CYAN|nr:response regulator [Planktothrix pseudagardhii]CAD5985894.1 Autoinducer 2 sensor kinase/phosphatase LuxQ [Planktothrix pseudagardhii]
MMKRFPLPLKFSIPAILIAYCTFSGITLFNRQVVESYNTQRTNAKNYLRIYAGQTARILDYLERIDTQNREYIDYAETTIISQLGSDINITLVAKIDENNIIYLSNHYELKGNPTSQTIAAAYLSNFASVREKQAGKILLSKDKKKLIAIYPLISSILPNEIKPSRTGILLIEYDLSLMKEYAFNTALKGTLIFNGGLMIFSFGLWFFFDFTLTRRVSQLVYASNSLAKGYLNTRTKLTGSDELMQISVAFDRMANKIQENADILQRQTEREILIKEITQRIRQSLELTTIFHTATKEIREFIDVDRVGIFQFDPESNNTSGKFISESVKVGMDSIMNIKITEDCFSEQCQIYYYYGRISILDDINEITMNQCYRHFLEKLKIQSNLVMPLVTQEKLWGLLCIQQCYEARKWQQSEIDFAQQISNQLSIGIQQAYLLNQTKKELIEKQRTETKLMKSNQELAISNEQLAQATRLKDEFLANMSHELRTPLNAILGMSEALTEEIFGPINQKQQQAIETIASSGTHLLSLINDILDVAKIESGKIELEFAPTSINELCQSSLVFIQQQARQKRLQIQTEIPPALPDLFVDERRIRQVLINLLNNAVKFTPKGGRVSLTVQVESSTETAFRRPSICFAVSDNGIGITSENQDKLFKPFVQIDSALNRQYAGTGLGLVLVKRIVEMHGGQLEVKSTVGVGSCFSFRLPYQQLPSQMPKSSSPQSSNLDGGKNPITQVLETSPVILLAEDNEANIITISRYLKAKGYQVILAKNGQEAINLVKSQSPDLILMDIQMPIMNGLEAIKQIREDSDHRLATLPIIALTALATTKDQEKCLEAGANDYLAKPVKLSQLTSTIQEILAKEKN